MKRVLLVLVATALAVLVPASSAFAGYPKPDSFKIQAPFAMGKVDLKESLFDGALEWSGKPDCKIKAKKSKCTWGGPKKPNGFARMDAAGDQNAKLTNISIFFGVNDKGEPIINQDSPLTKFATTRGKVHLGSLAADVKTIDPDVIEGTGGFILRGKDGEEMVFFTGGPGDKFVVGIALTD